MGKKRNSEPSEPSAAVQVGAKKSTPADVRQRAVLQPRLTKPHRLILITRPETTGRDEFGYRTWNPQKGVDVRVSKTMFKKALIVMDRFIKALETHDLDVKVIEDQRDRGTFACKGRDRVQVYIHEKTKRVEHVPTAKELKEKERYSRTRIPKWDHVHTGELVLNPGGVVDLSGVEAIDQLVRKAVADVIDELGRVRQRREQQEAASRREWERQQQIADEKRRAEALLKAADLLRQYRIVTDYIEEVRRFGRVPDDQRREGQSLEDWLAWAEAQAQRLHPFV